MYVGVLTSLLVKTCIFLESVWLKVRLMPMKNVNDNFVNDLMLRSVRQIVFRGKVKGVCPSPLNYNPFQSS